MTLQAKARKGVVTAFTGRDYSARHWRDVPAGCEEEARRNSLLEVRETQPSPEPDEQAQEDPTLIDYNEFTIKQLQGMVKDQGVRGHGRKKADLIAALEANNGK